MNQTILIHDTIHNRRHIRELFNIQNSTLNIQIDH